MSISRTFALGSLFFGLVTGACECDGIEGAAPRGYIDPAILDLGPVAIGTECTAILSVVNSGTADMSVASAILKDTNGSFQIQTVPGFVGLGDIQDLVIRYTAEGDQNVRQSTTVEVQTNVPDNDGLLYATVTAFPTDEQAALAVTVCDADDGQATPCPSLDFGPTPTSDPAIPVQDRLGKTLTVYIENQGNAEMNVAAAVIDGGRGDFAVRSLRLGTIETPAPVRLAPGRDGACGQPVAGACERAETCNRLAIDVSFAPGAIGADTAELVVLSDAAEGAELRVPLSGFGAESGLVLAPDYIIFSDVGEGQTGEVEVRVANLGTSSASVNNSCIDLGGDGTCDGNCTGGEPVLDGTLSCIVRKLDGSREGKGFVLAETNAAEGGDDERNVIVSWSPVAGASTIPAGTTLRLETNIGDNEVYEVPVTGGAAGILDVVSEAACGLEFCVPAMGDPDDVTTWTGSLTLRLQNSGEASLAITSLVWDGPETIADDYTVSATGGGAIDFANPALQLAPGAEVTLDVDYANDDFSGADIINLVVEHTGLGGLTTITLRPVPPS